METSDIFEAVIYAAVPALVGTLLTLLGKLYTPTSRLRRDLAADVKMLEGLPQSLARGTLAKEIERRTHLLIALTSYTPFSAKSRGLGVVALLASVVAGATAIRLVYSSEQSGQALLISTSLVLVLASLLLLSLIESEALAALAERSKYLRLNVDTQTAKMYREAAWIGIQLTGLLVVLINSIPLLSVSAILGGNWLYVMVAAVALLCVRTSIGLPRVTSGQRRWRQEMKA